MYSEGYLDLTPETRAEIFYKVFYKGYLDRELKQISKLKEVERVKIPADFEYKNISGLRNEAVAKLEEIRPATLAQAGRISGINPTDISIIHVMLHAKSKQKK